MASRVPSRVPVLAAVLGFVALVAATGFAAPPTFILNGLEFPAFSPNLDHVQDEAVYFFSLGDSAQVTVVVRQDASGSPGAVVDSVLRFEPLPPGPDTARWTGVNGAGGKMPDGTYWITAHAENVDGAVDATPLSVILDTVAPRDTLATPARTFIQTLVHQVIGEVSDRNGLDHVVVTLGGNGKTLPDTVCAPCASDTAQFTLGVPDSIAATDSLHISIDSRDLAGNGRSRFILVVVDSLAPPAPVLDPIPSPVERDSASAFGTASEAESVTVTLDGVEAGRSRVGAGFRFEAKLRRFPQGTHVVVATSHDRAGNVSPPSAPVSFLYQEPLGVVIPERLQLGDYLQVNLSKPAAAVHLRIYDLSGRLIRRLEERATGTIYEFAWDLRDERGNPIGSGPCVVQVEANFVDGSRLAKRLATVVTR